jgi:hypothetical protein
LKLLEGTPMTNFEAGGHPDLRFGDPVVVLYQGLYDGMDGRFAGLREDPNWADVEEGDGSVRAHPVLWLRRRKGVRDVPASRV